MDFDRDDWLYKQLRRISYKYPPRYTAKQRARIERGKYKCALCQGIFRDKDTEMDHIAPVASVEGTLKREDGSIDWNVCIPRMLPYIEGWQLVCHDCHVKKSVNENSIRRTKKKLTIKE